MENPMRGRGQALGPTPPLPNQIQSQLRGPEEEQEIRPTREIKILVLDESRKINLQDAKNVLNLKEWESPRKYTDESTGQTVILPFALQRFVKRNELNTPLIPFKRLSMENPMRGRGQALGPTPPLPNQIQSQLRGPEEEQEIRPTREIKILVLDESRKINLQDAKNVLNLKEWESPRKYTDESTGQTVILPFALQRFVKRNELNTPLIPFKRLSMENPMRGRGQALGPTPPLPNQIQSQLRGPEEEQEIRPTREIKILVLDESRKINLQDAKNVLNLKEWESPRKYTDESTGQTVILPFALQRFVKRNELNTPLIPFKRLSMENPMRGRGQALGPTPPLPNQIQSQLRGPEEEQEIRPTREIKILVLDESRKINLQDAKNVLNLKEWESPRKYTDESTGQTVILPFALQRFVKRNELNTPLIPFKRLSMENPMRGRGQALGPTPPLPNQIQSQLRGPEEEQEIRPTREIKILVLDESRKINLQDAKNVLNLKEWESPRKYTDESTGQTVILPFALQRFVKRNELNTPLIPFKRLSMENPMRGRGQALGPTPPLPNQIQSQLRGPEEEQEIRPTRVQMKTPLSDDVYDYTKIMNTINFKENIQSNHSHNHHESPNQIKSLHKAILLSPPEIINDFLNDV